MVAFIILAAKLGMYRKTNPPAYGLTASRMKGEENEVQPV
jgi:hypothetical protein